MDLKNIQKNYSKLTAGERFSLLFAAADRDDERELAALQQSSPTHTWKIPTTRGLSEAFTFFSMWHVINQMGRAASFFYILSRDDEDRINFINRGKAYDAGELLLILQRQILTSGEAWRVVCKNYGVDPDKIIESFPYVEIIEMAELIARITNDESPQDLQAIQQQNIEDLTAAIEIKRKDWE